MAESPSSNMNDVVAGRYRLGEVIGRGGMSSVYSARDENLGRDVALKLFAPQAPDAGELKRQEAEITMLATLNHPSLVTLFDAGIDTRIPDEPRPFLTMELADGQDLRTRIRHSPVPLGRTRSHWRRGRRRAVLRPQPGDHPPGHQTRQHPPGADPPRGAAAGQAHRLRNSQNHRCHPPDRNGGHGGNRGVPQPGAGHGLTAHPGHGRLLAGTGAARMHQAGDGVSRQRRGIRSGQAAPAARNSRRTSRPSGRT